MRTSLYGLATALFLTATLGVRAQEPRTPMQPASPDLQAPQEGSVDIGFRGTDATGDVARLERYRDLRSGAFSRIVFVRRNDEYLFDARADNIGYRDQRYRADFRGSKLQFRGVFDSVPLNFGYQTSTPWVEQTPGVLTIDPAARQAVQSKLVVGVPQTANDLRTPSIYRGIANPFDLEYLRQTGAFSFLYDMNRQWAFDGAFSSAAKNGHQPFGASFAFNVANEVPLPIDNRTNDASAGLEWTSEQSMLRVGWNGSWFLNNIHELVWDNPYRATDQTPYDPSAYTNGNGPARGRLATAPSNVYNSINLMGVHRFSAKTTANGSVSFTRMSQDDALIPWTINPVIANNAATLAQFPNLRGLPRTTAEASVDGVNAIFNFSARPTRMFGITARYRFNDHSNNTPPFDATQYVRFDAVPESTGGITEQFNVRQNLFDLNATFNVLPYTALRIGYGYDSFDRTGRAFSNMSDNIFRASIDTVGNQWLTVRALYEFTKRKGSGFSEDAIEEGGSQPGLRFYDEADRDRHRGTLLFILNPREMYDVTFSLTAGKDTYGGPGHEFGLLDNNNESYNIGVNFYPAGGLTFGANYGREHFSSDQKSRNANPPPDPQFTDPTRDWTLNNTENVNNFDLFAEVPKLGQKAGLRVSYDYSDSDNGFLFGGPRIASLSAIGQFIPLPNVTNTWHRVAVDLHYMFVQKMGVGLGYWFENFDVTDFNTIDIPGQPGTPRIDYLGILSTGYGNRPYRGNTAFVRLLYLF